MVRFWTVIGGHHHHHRRGGIKRHTSWYKKPLDRQALFPTTSPSTSTKKLGFLPVGFIRNAHSLT
eukprot:184233-Rhodomonas_salina.3